MSHLNRNSLCATLDCISESLFFKKNIPESQRIAAAKWIARRQGLPGSYANMFAPAAKDTSGIQLFTGEVVRTQAAIAHILGEESCRILTLLQVKDQQVRASLNRAVQGLVARLEEAERRGYCLGTYCCGTCSAAYWRNLAIGLLARAEERLRLGLNQLKRVRKDNGTWRRFPFLYTCLALTEIGPELAKSEMQYAALYWQKNLRRFSSSESCIARRRAAVGRRLLELCEN